MKNKADAIVAILVILCSAVLLGALVFSIAGNPLQKPHLRFTVDFKDITGVKANSDVLFAGYWVGFVEKVEHIPPEDRLIDDYLSQVQIAIVKPLDIPANIDVFLNAESMLGEKHVAIKRGPLTDELLADGARIMARPASSMLDSMGPEASELIAKLLAIADNLKDFTGRLDDGADGENISQALANINTFTEELKIAFAGEEVRRDGIRHKIEDLADNLSGTAIELREFISGPEGEREEGLAGKTDVVMKNLQEFSRELNLTLAGTPDGGPGLRAKLNNIADEIQVTLAGAEGTSEIGVRRRMDSVLRKADNLMLELQALVIWGEYITGTLSEKPSRLIFGNKTNEVPTKEQIIEYLRNNEKPYPVIIRDNNPAGDPRMRPAPAPGESAASGQAPPPKKKRGLFQSLKKE